MSLSQRQTFIASHAPEDGPDRRRQSISSSPGLDEDEADEVPYNQVNPNEEMTPQSPKRPSPGGSFPSATRLDDAAMYNRHSPAISEITNELHPPRILRDEEVAPIFGPNYDFDRPITGGTEMSTSSIGDDRYFSNSTARVSIGATIVGSALSARRDEDDETSKEVEHANVSSKSVGPHETAGYYTGTTPMSLRTDFIPPVPAQPETTGESISYPTSSKYNFIGTDNNLGSAAVATTVGDTGGTPPTPLSHFWENSELPISDSVTGGDVERKSPAEKDALPTELTGSTQTSTLAAPASTVRRIRSKREIVEEAIAESIGNHPERGVTPGGWPETPA
jgi:hypothetical protein